MKRANQNKEAKEERRLGAAGRAEYFATLTPQQKLARLDARLGPGVGAVKERAKLAKALTDAAKPATKEAAKTVFKEEQGGGKKTGKKAQKQPKK